MQIQQYLNQQKSRVEALLSSQLDCEQNPSRLDEAMYYAVMNGGKRLRPVLAYASAEALGADSANADIAACCVELIHAYSLIHDDLPSMDDDLLRRGKPTCHVQFDEATAILAGDALQSLAFELLASSPELKVTDEVRVEMMRILSKAVGRSGMVGGQSIDLNAEKLKITESDLAAMHAKKTGALIIASVQLGALSTGIASSSALDKLSLYAQNLGLAFQVQDDILDVESDTETLGKQQGKDQELGKTTYPDLLGVEGARQKAHDLCEEAVSVLEGFGDAAQALRKIALYVVQRNH